MRAPLPTPSSASGVLRRVTVRQTDADTVTVSQPLRGPKRYRLDDPTARHRLRPHTLSLVLPDPSALLRLAESRLLEGELRRLTVRLARAPQWLTAGSWPARIGGATRALSWRRAGDALRLSLAWSDPYPVRHALRQALSMLLRAEPGPASAAPVGEVVTAIANPFGRRLVGAATPYLLTTDAGRLVLREPNGRAVLRFDRSTGAEATLLRGTMSKYAVISVGSPLPSDRFTDAALRALAACGAVFAAPDPTTRRRLGALGLVTVADPTEVDDLRGYGLSVAAARAIAIADDALLRRSPLHGGACPPPSVTAILASMRVEYLESCLDYLAAQTYPALEVLVGSHGYEVPRATRQRWQDLPVPVRVCSFPAELPFGAVLGQLSRAAEGDLLTKVDDDDHYGPHHVTDLVVALRTSRGDLAAKGARFVHFPERKETIDRAWAAPELFNVTPAGGTLLFTRDTLHQIGGWSHSSRHVDTDLLTRIKSAGGQVYRTHGLEYVYVRRSTGHTFVTEIDSLLAHGEQVYDGLPEQIIRPQSA